MIKIACIGDSLTYGHGSKTTSYPKAMQQLLGSEYEIRNFGVNGACISGDLPYNTLSVYQTSAAFQPDTVVIMLGTNDAKSYNWNETAFRDGFAALIAYYQNLGSEPNVYVVTSPRIDSNTDWLDYEVLQNTIVALQKEMAKRYGCAVIDMNAATADAPKPYYNDGVHFTDEGYRFIAETIANAIRCCR